MNIKFNHMQYTSALLFFVCTLTAHTALSAPAPIPIPPGRSAWIISRTEKNIVPSTLRSATVYRKGAELVHTATATLEQGNNELIIEDISNTLDEGSIRVSCKDNVTVMSVSFSTEYLKPESVSPTVRKLQDSIEAIKKQQGVLNVLIKSNNELLDLIGSNKSIGGANNGLSVAELSKMVDYYKEKVIAIRTEVNGYNEKMDKLARIIEKLQNQVQEEEIKNSKTGGRLLLQLLAPIAGTFTFTVSYLTQAAYWVPFYDLKVDNVNDPLHVSYKAKIVQTSGIDWKKVKLSLSTSTPSQGGNAPVMKTWFLRFLDPAGVVKGYYSNSGLVGSVAGLSVDKVNSLQDVVVSAYGVEKKESFDAGYVAPLYIVNGQFVSAETYKRIDPRAIKSINVLKSKDAAAIYGARGAGGVTNVTLKDELGDYVSVNDNQMDVTFDIDIPYDVPSNGKEQGVVLKEYKVPCTYRYYAAPRLDKDAYLLGEVPDWEKLNFLPGEASIMVEGTYIGMSFIDPGSTMDTLKLTLGRDKRIVVKKEKVTDYSSVKFLGSNKKQLFTYEITVRNNKKDKTTLLLKDQYPVSSDKDIEIELLENGGAIVDNNTGFLTWPLTLAPGEIKKIRISYSVKYPKDKSVNIN